MNSLIQGVLNREEQLGILTKKVLLGSVHEEGSFVLESNTNKQNTKTNRKPQQKITRIPTSVRIEFHNVCPHLKFEIKKALSLQEVLPHMTAITNLVNIFLNFISSDCK